MKGILKKSETRDTMIWCFAMPDKPRPKDFSAHPGTNHKLIELDRFNESTEIETIRSSKGLTFKASNGWVKKVVLESPTPEAISALNSLYRLETLTLGFADDKIAEALAAHPSLRNLRLECDVSPSVLDKLVGKISKLEKLDFRCRHFTAAHGKALANSKSLTTIHLSHNSGNYDGFKELVNRSVNSLRISSSQFPISNINLIGSSLPKLEKLSFINCGVSSDKMPPIHEHERLENVKLIHCHIDDDSNKYLSMLPALKQLEINYKPWINN